MAGELDPDADAEPDADPEAAPDDAPAEAELLPEPAAAEVADVLLDAVDVAPVEELEQALTINDNAATPALNATTLCRTALCISVHFVR